jgi:photosystem II stability/assembly factor-like uncharacterized protein
LIAFDGQNTMLAIGDVSFDTMEVSISHNKGLTWAVLPLTGIPIPSMHSAAAVAYGHGIWAVADAQGNIAMSTNGGQSWDYFYPLIDGNNSAGLVTLEFNGAYFLATCFSGKIYKLDLPPV